MRGFWHHNQQDRAEDFANAIDWQRRAIKIGPGFARPYMALARSLYARCLFGHSLDIELDAKECLVAAERAVALDSRDAYSHYAMCLAHLLSGRPTEALAAAEHATEINPSLALAHNAVGWARIFVGRAADAIDPLTTAMRLSPQDSLTYLFLSRIGLAHYHLRNFAESVRFSERALSLRRRHFIMVVLLAGLGQIGREEEARSLAPALEAMTPPDRHRYWRMITLYLNPADHDLFFDGLRKAGVLVDDYGR
jgi:tetratricopeptide (TPR) repeat protein